MTSTTKPGLRRTALARAGLRRPALGVKPASTSAARKSAEAKAQAKNARRRGKSERGTTERGAHKRSRTRQGAAQAVTPPEGWTPPTWEEVVQQHSARVYRLAYRLTGNQQDAEDLTHDVFLRVFRSLDSYRPGTFEGWLHRITTNLFLDRMRRKQRIRFEALGEDAGERLPGRLPSPEESFAAHHFDTDVQAALDDLSPDFRAAVVLCDIEGLSYEEISEVLGIKLGTVRSRISRGRAQLRSALAHRDPALRRRAVTVALNPA